MYPKRNVLSAYHPAWGTPVNYSVTRLPDAPDRQVEATVAHLIALIKQTARDPLLQKLALRCLRQGGGDPIAGIWPHVKQIQFEQDIDIARALDVDEPWKEDVVEVFIHPLEQATLIAQGKGIGDCDCFELYALSLLTALGIPCALVTVAADPERTKEYSHIYGAAYLNGQRVPLDFSHGPYPGWECPNRYGKRREWPVNESILINTVALGAVLFAGYYAYQRWAA